MPTGASAASDSFTGRTAIVTGAGRGFGRAIAELLAERGAAVAVLDIDGDAAAAVAAGIRRRGARAIPLAADVTSDEQVHSAVARATAELGALDILVNNAGIVSTTPIEELERPEWERTLAVDLTSLFVVTKAVIPAMIDRRSGAIVSIASLAGKRGGGIFGKCAYATAKAGVLGFTKSIARELAPYGIRANAVAPGAFGTEMTRAFLEDEQVLGRVLATIPLGRLGQPADVARTVAFLASDEASYLTGETINLDGGILME